MRMLRSAVPVLFLFVLAAVPPAQAQTPWQIGPYLGLNLSDQDDLLAGATARIHLESAPITLNPSIEFYPTIGPNASLFALNFDAQYELEADTFEPYVGGGISWTRASSFGASRSDAGLNLKGGTLFNARGRGRPYVEATLNLTNGGEALIFKGGFLFTVGG